VLRAPTRQAALAHRVTTGNRYVWSASGPLASFTLVRVFGAVGPPGVPIIRSCRIADPGREDGPNRSTTQLGAHLSQGLPRTGGLTAVVSLRFSPAWVARRPQLEPGPRCSRAAGPAAAGPGVPLQSPGPVRARAAAGLRFRRPGSRCATTKQRTEALPAAVRAAADPRLRLRHMVAGGRYAYRPQRGLRAVEAAACE